MAKLNDTFPFYFDLTNEIDLDTRAKLIFEYYREKGFPNYESSKYSVKKQLERVKSIDENAYFDSERKIIKKYSALNGFLFSYFPHWITVRCNNAPSLFENWANDDMLLSLIKKTIIWCPKHNENWSTNRIRQNAKVFCAGQSVSNFNVIASKYIYNTYGNNGVVYDMSCGWGARLLGFMGSNCNTYLGVEPSSKTFNGLLKLSSDLQNVESGKIVRLAKIGSEDFAPEEKSVDLAFTSIPYFDTEKYAEEDTQSFRKFPTIEKWQEGYLCGTIRNCYVGLKDNGTLIINVANVLKHDLVQLTIDSATQEGFVLSDTLFLEMSSISGKGAKLEPILVFKKG